MKLLKTKKIFKAIRNGALPMGDTNLNDREFLLKAMEAKRKWRDLFICWGKNNSQTLSPARLCFRNENEIKIFSDEVKLKAWFPTHLPVKTGQERFLEQKGDDTKASL